MSFWDNYQDAKKFSWEHQKAWSAKGVFDEEIGKTTIDKRVEPMQDPTRLFTIDSGEIRWDDIVEDYDYCLYMSADDNNQNILTYIFNNGQD